ncbi:MAG: oligosaccharide flippase family protein [Candidatus Methanomethyliaceae archaeon]
MMESERSLTRMFLDLFAAAGWYGTGMALRQVVAFLLLPIYTRYLSPASLGVLSVLGMAQLFLMVIFTLGLTPALFRFGADPEVTKHFKQGNILGTTFIVLLVWNGLLGSVFLITAGCWANLLFGDPGLASIIRVLSLLLVSESLGLGCFAGGVLRLKKRASIYALLSVVQVAIQVIIAYITVARFGWGLWGAVLAMVVASVSVTLFALLLIFKELSWRWAFLALGEMLRYSLALIPGLLAMGVLDVADRYILRLLLGLGPVGIYEAGYRIGKMVNFALAPFSAALPPLLYSLGVTEKSRSFLSRVSTYMLALSLGTATLISILAREITAVVAGPEYMSSWSVVPWIAFGTAAFHMTNVWTSGLQFVKKAGYISMVTIFFAILTIALLCLTVPILGISGAAFTTLVTFVGMAALMLVISLREYPVPYEFGRKTWLALLAIAAFALSYRIPEALRPNIIIGLKIGAITFVFIVPVFFIFRDEAKAALRKVYYQVAARGGHAQK